MPSTKQFDVNDALERAMEVFWEKGYEATSMTLLLSRMGIQKGSFYATFESKDAVYKQAIKHYVTERFAAFEREIGDRAPRKAIEQMFDIVQRECKGGAAAMGCMIVNAALERAPEDQEIAGVVRDTLAYHEKMLTKLVEDGQRAGEITKRQTAKQIAQGLMALTVTMRVYGRAGMPSARISGLRGQVKALLD